MRTRIDNQVASPCIDHCCLGDDDICTGCFRSLQEILSWGDADSLTRMEILRQVAIRKNE
ncbi:MAG: DUF1289 domain-containing protein [Arenicellales bacterium]